MGKLLVWGLVAIGFSLVACDQGDVGRQGAPLSRGGQAAQEETGKPQRPMDLARISSGVIIYREKCAECHGPNGEGAPTWRQRGEDGFYPAPPLNGSGHTWHHPKQVLRRVIREGSPGGQGKMPAWKEQLSDQQIEDIIAWFQSRWPDEQYVVWMDIDTRARDRTVSR